MSPRIFSLPSFFLLFLAIGCAPSPMPEGKWQMDFNDGTFSSYISWEFKGTEFIQEGYPPIYRKGRFKIIQDADTMQIRLFDIESTAESADDTILVFVSEGQNSIWVDNQGPFLRIY